MNNNEVRPVRSIYMPAGEMLEKYFRSRLVKEQEFEFRTAEDVVVGFLSAIDDEWIQVCETQTTEAWMIRTENVTALKTTGKCLDDIDAKQRKEIKRFCGMMFKIAKGSDMKPAGHVG